MAAQITIFKHSSHHHSSVFKFIEVISSQRHGWWALLYLSSIRGVETQSEWNSADPDPTRDLNNFLQARKDNNGNFARHFSWLMTDEGPDNQKTHYATAKCEPFCHSEDSVLSCAVRGQEIGHGMGVSMGVAKKMASEKALRYLRSLPENHSLFSTQ